MKPVHTQIALLCPEAVSGGPEALHQLADTINRFGGDARMAYYGRTSKLTLAPDRLTCTTEAAEAMAQQYAAYNPRVVSDMACSKDTLIIFPEGSSDLARNCRSGTRAIWWLSVDNALIGNPRLNYPSYCDWLFADPELIHFYQSDYARDFLMSRKAKNVIPLFDFSDQTFIGADKVKPAKRSGIAFFPRKGKELAAPFIAGAGDLKFLPIENMTKAQVKDTLSHAAIYIDFGHHPGKDRVPREAALAGAVLLLHEKGAATCFADHPLPRDYIFNLADIQTGMLRKKVDAILADPAAHRERQHYYVQKVLMEKEEFELQVKTFFFKGRP